MPSLSSVGAWSGDGVARTPLFESVRPVEARAVADRLVTDAEQVGSHLDAARGRILLARIDESDAEIRRAEQLAHDALASLVELGARPAALDARQVLARVDELCGHPERASAIVEGIAEARARLIAGDAVDLTGMVELAQRGGGERRRSDFGWDSLTPTELAVVVLVAEGLTNPQLAERLVVGRATVETHVSNALRKLGVTSRTQLATEHRTRTGGHRGGTAAPPPC